VEAGKQKEYASLLQMLLKPILTYGKEEPGDSCPIINEWGGAGEGQVRAVSANLGPGMGNLHIHIQY
jgi:hypothetical protein